MVSFRISAKLLDAMTALPCLAIVEHALQQTLVQMIKRTFYLKKTIAMCFLTVSVIFTAYVVLFMAAFVAKAKTQDGRLSTPDTIPCVIDWISHTMKLRLYRVCVCTSLTHCCEAWTLNRMVTRSINGFNSRCLHVMTSEHYRETATAPAYDLVLVVRRCRLCYLGHVLCMPADRMVRCAFMALVSDSILYPTCSLFSDCQGVALSQLVTMASNRAMWRAKVASLA